MVNKQWQTNTIDTSIELFQNVINLLAWSGCYHIRNENLRYNKHYRSILHVLYSSVNRVQFFKSPIFQLISQQLIQAVGTYKSIVHNLIELTNHAITNLPLI